MKRLLIIFFFTICDVACIAQTQAPLPSVSRTGFYKVLLTPDVTKFLTEDFANLRIFNGTKATAYFLENDALYTTNEFTPYKIVRHELNEGCCTTVIFETDSKHVISNLHIRIRNADVSKIGTLSGSDDLQRWYAVKGDFYFSPVNNPDGTTELRNVDVPLSDYRYYSLKFSDSVSAPLKIESVGYYKEFTVAPTYREIEIGSVRIWNDDKRRVTMVDVDMDTLNWIDRITFNASGVPYFLRDVIVKTPRVSKTKRKDANGYDFLHQQKISSDRKISFDLPSVKLSELQIEISNNDDAPLEVDEVTLWQKSHYAIVWLEAGPANAIVILPADAARPKYDIVNFRKDVPAHLPQLEPGEVVLPAKSVQSERETWFGINLMWIGIVSVIVLLGFLSVKLIRETKMS